MAGKSARNPEQPFDFQVQCPVDATLLHVIRRFVSSVAEDAGFSPDEAAHIEMAVDEACSNVALHAYRQRGESAEGDKPRIEIKIRLENEGLTIHIQDHGCGGRPEHYRGAESIPAYQKPDRSEYHGLGILIMREFMDEVDIMARPESGTCVMLRKRLSRLA